MGEGRVELEGGGILGLCWDSLLGIVWGLGLGCRVRVVVVVWVVKSNWERKGGLGEGLVLGVVLGF